MRRITFLLLATLTLTLPACGAGATTAQGEGEPKENPVVLIETNMGNIQVELFINKSPITVKNFLGYVDTKFYDGTVFHRVIPTFMIQGGGFKPGVEKATTPQQFQAAEKETGPPIRNEATNGVPNARGTIAMARTTDPDSATAQFFINVKDNPNLNAIPGASAGYAVFGKVTEGMDVVDKIKAVKTKELFRGVADVPIEPVIIKSIRRVEKKPDEKKPDEKKSDEKKTEKKDEE